MTPDALPPLSPTDRTTIGRERERAQTDRTLLHEVLDEALVGHLGVVVGEGSAAHPVVLPVAFAVDPDGPDEGGTLYVHGSVAARWLRATEGASVCFTATLVDGLVLARSGFNHSMNYRSAVVIGVARIVDDPAERAHALDLTVDHVVPGRAATLRASTRKELAATAMLAVPMLEASLKTRAGGSEDEPEDVEAGTWAGHLPLRQVAGELVPEPEVAHQPVPDDVVARVGDLGGRTPYASGR